MERRGRTTYLLYLRTTERTLGWMDGRTGQNMGKSGDELDELQNVRQQVRKEKELIINTSERASF